MNKGGRQGAVIGLFVVACMLLFTSCGTSAKDFYGEYSLDGRGPAGITILDDGTVELNFAGYAEVEYDKKKDRLEVVEADVYRTYEDPISKVDFQLTESDNLLYTKYIDGEVYDQLELVKIPGTTGETGTAGMFWVSAVSWFIIIVSVAMIGLFFFLHFGRQNRTG